MHRMTLVQQAPGGSAFFLGEREGRTEKAGAAAAAEMKCDNRGEVQVKELLPVNSLFQLPPL